MIEFEKKVLLTKQEYDILYSKCSHLSEYVQKNYYYDTHSLSFDKMGITCRVREKDAKYTATIKIHSIDNIDYSIENSRRTASAYDSSFFKNLNAFFQGTMVTRRTVLLCEEDLKAVLDKNDYLGVTDYELEIEYPMEKETYALNLLDYYKEILRYYECGEKALVCSNGKGKAKRFFKRKNDITNKKV